jgi:hypothetical protein
VDKDRVFWEAVRRALLLFAKAIEIRYLASKPDTAHAGPDVIYSKQ